MFNFPQSLHDPSDVYLDPNWLCSPCYPELIHNPINNAIKVIPCYHKKTLICFLNYCNKRKAQYIIVTCIFVQSLIKMEYIHKEKECMYTCISSLCLYFCLSASGKMLNRSRESIPSLGRSVSPGPEPLCLHPPLWPRKGMSVLYEETSGLSQSSDCI